VRKLKEIPEDELDDVLCRFYAEIRKQNGDEYEPESVAVKARLLRPPSKIQRQELQHTTRPQLL